MPGMLRFASEDQEQHCDKSKLKFHVFGVLQLWCHYKLVWGFLIINEMNILKKHCYDAFSNSRGMFHFQYSMIFSCSVPCTIDGEVLK